MTEKQLEKGQELIDEIYRIDKWLGDKMDNRSSTIGFSLAGDIAADLMARIEDHLKWKLGDLIKQFEAL